MNACRIINPTDVNTVQKKKVEESNELNMVFLTLLFFFFPFHHLDSRRQVRTKCVLCKSAYKKVIIIIIIIIVHGGQKEIRTRGKRCKKDLSVPTDVPFVFFFVFFLPYWVNIPEQHK